jgi:hypothetical protein
MMSSYIVFGFTQPVIEATIDHTRGENANHYKTYKTKQQNNINKKNNRLKHIYRNTIFSGKLTSNDSLHSILQYMFEKEH